MKTLVFDTETTDIIKNSLQSLDRQPRVIEIFALSLDGEGQEIGSYHSFFNPGIKISKEVQAITNIDDSMVKDAPAFRLKADEIIELIEDHDEVVAHNASFDTSVMNFEFKRVAKSVQWPSVICTVEATEYMKGHRMKLADLHEFLFGEKFSGAHRAENDVRALARCFLKLRELGTV